MATKVVNKNSDWQRKWFSEQKQVAHKTPAGENKFLFIGDKLF